MGRKKKPETERKIKEIVDLLDAGMTMKEVACAVGVSYNYVQQIRKDVYIPDLEGTLNEWDRLHRKYRTKKEK